MEPKISKVKTKNIAQSPQKLRLIVDLVRGKSVDEALDILEFTNKKGRVFVKKTILSGVANAREQYGVESGELQIRNITVDEAPTLKRGRFASRGRHSVILKRRAHLNLELEVK